MRMRSINECDEGTIINLRSQLSNIVKAVENMSVFQVTRMHLLKNFCQYVWTPKHGVNLEEFNILVSLGKANLMPDHQLNALIDMTNTHKIEHSYFGMRWMNKLIACSTTHDADL
jgi:hypothetical protein